jgi:hypothetical protein
MLSNENKSEIRNTILKWASTEVSSCPSYLRNKAAVVLAILIKMDFPVLWPTAFSELIQFMPAHPLQTEMALRTLLALDEEVVDKSLPRR